MGPFGAGTLRHTAAYDLSSRGGSDSRRFSNGSLTRRPGTEPSDHGIQAGSTWRGPGRTVTYYLTSDWASLRAAIPPSGGACRTAKDADGRTSGSPGRDPTT